jgi:hypothetical protein
MVSQELGSWRTTAIILLTISLTILIVQRTNWAFLDPVFEVCIFHIPAILAVGIYFYVSKNRKNFELQTKSNTTAPTTLEINT